MLCDYKSLLRYLNQNGQSSKLNDFNMKTHQKIAYKLTKTPNKKKRYKNKTKAFKKVNNGDSIHPILDFLEQNDTYLLSGYEQKRKQRMIISEKMLHDLIIKGSNNEYKNIEDDDENTILFHLHQLNAIGRVFGKFNLFFFVVFTVFISCIIS